jgi:hypothetical protein
LAERTWCPAAAVGWGSERSRRSRSKGTDRPSTSVQAAPGSRQGDHREECGEASAHRAMIVERLDAILAEEEEAGGEEPEGGDLRDGNPRGEQV